MPRLRLASRLLLLPLVALLVLFCTQPARCQQEEGFLDPPADLASLAPAPEQEYEMPPLSAQEVVDLCVALVNRAGPPCSTESDTINLNYGRQSITLPTPAEESSALAALKNTGLPSTGCCRNLKPFVDERCPCLKPFQELLPTGGFAAAYFEGATAILATACDFDFPPC